MQQEFPEDFSPTTEDSSLQPPANNSARKVSPSDRKIQANRRNARRSTGPKTVRGKRNIAHNALKHGLFSTAVVITAGDGKETLKDFEALIKELRKSYAPVGLAEEMLVHEIAEIRWRKRRIIRAENGAIRRRLDNLRANLEVQKSDRANRALALQTFAANGGLFSKNSVADLRLSTHDRVSALHDLQRAVRDHSAGQDFLVGLLRSALSEMHDDGELSDHVRSTLFQAFDVCDPEFATAIALDPDSLSPETIKEDEFRDLLTQILVEQVSKIHTLQKQTAERARLEVDAELLSSSLPPAHELDKIMRYEAHLDRKEQRAEDRLERLQRQRKGEAVPPPININLARRS